LSYTQQYSARENPAFPCINTTFTNPINPNLQFEEREVLVDSGAPFTCISDSTIETCQLVPCGTRDIGDSENGGLRTKMLYFVRVSFGRFSFVVKAIQTNGDSIIGRDIINQLTIILNGPAKKLEGKR